METEQKEDQATEQASAPEQEPAQAPQSVGALLKTERERLGLSLEQITDMTRMRTPVIEAIENEAWASLPPPVFVRGFLRTYAKVLGVSQETVMDLYTRSVPQESPALPHPEPSMNRRGRAWLVVVFLAVLAMAYGLWHYASSVKVDQGSQETEKKEQQVAAPAQPVVAPPAPVQPAAEPKKEEPVPVASASPEPPPAPPKEVEQTARAQADEDGWLSLTGIVKERTWLRITIDGKEEKEYLFQPGSRPQWRGKQRFYMLIGNAAGIEFDLNGKRVANLGNPGQVIRLTLPKDAGQQERAN